MCIFNSITSCNLNVVYIFSASLLLYCYWSSDWYLSKNSSCFDTYALLYICLEFEVYLASERSETRSGVYKFELVRYIYMYGGTCAILVAHATHT